MEIRMRYVVIAERITEIIIILGVIVKDALYVEVSYFVADVSMKTSKNE